MINPKELRIGNYVQDIKYGISVVVAFDDTEVDINVNNNFIMRLKNHLYPIPLTEEWLLKFGFDTYINNDSYYHVKDLIKGILVEDHFILDYYELAPCKHVHQLQNLYFALTGEDLTIKD